MSGSVARTSLTRRVVVARSTIRRVESGAEHQVLLGLSWAESLPRVRARIGTHAASTFVPLLGMQLNYRSRLDSPRHCVGQHRFRGGPYVDCPRGPVLPGRTCASCAASDAVFAANLHHAHTRDRHEIDPAIAVHLAQPNVLYLAAFRDGSIKVGTSTEKRSAERLTEQGAWLARVVARTEDGYAVRVLEDRITEELGLAQSVPMSRKMAGMHRPQADDHLRDELDRHAAAVADLLSIAGQTPSDPLEEQWRNPRADDAIWEGLHPYPLRLDSGQHDLEVVDACGRMIAVRRPHSNDTFLADLQQLYGVGLQLGDFESDALAVQDSLF